VLGGVAAGCGFEPQSDLELFSAKITMHTYNHNTGDTEDLMGTIKKAFAVIIFA
jgi:hypothetical protein